MSDTEQIMSRLALDYIEENGPVSHGELTRYLPVESRDDTQEIIMELRARGMVRLTLGNNYEVEDGD